MVKGSDKGVSRESCAEATFLSVTRGSNRQRRIPASKRSKEGAERRRFRRIPPGYAGSKNRTVQDLGRIDIYTLQLGFYLLKWKYVAKPL